MQDGGLMKPKARPEGILKTYMCCYGGQEKIMSLLIWGPLKSCWMADMLQ